MENHFAGAGEAHAVARDLFDGGGIRFETVNALLELLVFVIELRDLRFHPLNLIFRAVHGDQTVGAEDVLKKQQEKREREEVASIVTKETLRLVVICVRARVHVCSHGRGPYIQIRSHSHLQR